MKNKIIYQLLLHNNSVLISSTRHIIAGSISHAAFLLRQYMKFHQKIRFSHGGLFFLKTCKVFSKTSSSGKGDSKDESMSHTKCSKKSIEPLKKELKAYRKNGIVLFMDGSPGTPKSIAKACMAAEGGGYMRDYTEDENGKIARVDFNRITGGSSE